MNDETDNQMVVSGVLVQCYLVNVYYKVITTPIPLLYKYGKITAHTYN